MEAKRPKNKAIFKFPYPIESFFTILASKFPKKVTLASRWTSSLILKTLLTLAFKKFGQSTQKKFQDGDSWQTVIKEMYSWPKILLAASMMKGKKKISCLWSKITHWVMSKDLFGCLKC